MAEEEDDTSSNYGIIDTTDLSSQIWLVRIPPKLATAWNDPNIKEGTTLGTLTFTRGTAPNAKPMVKQSMAVSVSPDLANTDLPLDYTIEGMTKKVPTFYPFTRNNDGSVVMHGQISRTANLQMKTGSTEYRTFCRNRLLTSVAPNRVVRPVETVDLTIGRSGGGATNSSTGIRPPTGGEGFGDAIMKHGKQMLEASERNNEDRAKKRKFEGQSTRSVVFELFEQQRFWTVKELRNASGRLEKELRPVLSELCEFHRSGEQKGTWELKKEFQMQEGA